MHWTAECVNRAQLQSEGEIQSTSPEDTGQMELTLKPKEAYLKAWTLNAFSLLLVFFF